MMALAISIGLMFSLGFGGGYVTRATMSMLRRSKQRKQRSTVDNSVKPVAAVVPVPMPRNDANVPRVANA